MPCVQYLALVQSIISYGIVVWGNASKFALNPFIIIYYIGLTVEIYTIKIV
jgi:hypothetical protein